MSDAPSPARTVPHAALQAVLDAFENVDEESSTYLDLESGAPISVTDIAKSDLEAVMAFLPETFAGLMLGDQRTVLADTIENADGIWSTPEEIEQAFLVRAGLGTRYLAVPRPSTSEHLRIMEAFVLTVPSAGLRDRLDDAIRGRAPFRRFRDVLRGEMVEEKRWGAFKHASLAERAQRWLRDQGLALADT